MHKSRIVCFFSEAQSEQPIIYRLVKDFDLVINILKADINPRKEGYLVVELSGEREHYESGISFLKDIGVRVEPLSQTVVWQEESCTQCGACASFCPTGALAIDRSSMEVSFDNARCVVCGMCLDCCPTRAVTVFFNISAPL
ncbi:MAG: NIL domain-containing protein [Syntrophomonadales bacterium]|jgi:ferredoxin